MASQQLGALPDGGAIRVVGWVSALVVLAAGQRREEGAKGNHQKPADNQEAKRVGAKVAQETAQDDWAIFDPYFAQRQRGGSTSDLANHHHQEIQNRAVSSDSLHLVLSGQAKHFLKVFGVRGYLRASSRALQKMWLGYRSESGGISAIWKDDEPVQISDHRDAL